MRISFRVILGIWILLFAVMGVLVYITYNRLQPETITTLLKEQVEKNYPGATVKIGSIDYYPSLDLSLTFKNVDISRATGKLASIGELEVRIPWWLLVTDRGNAQINLSKLEVIVHSGHSPKNESSGEITKEKTKIKVSLPEYLAHARYTLRAKDIIIKDAEDSRRYFALSKLLVKEFQYGKNSAFELNLPIEINHNKAKFTAELWLFGDLTPMQEMWNLNFRGEFRTRDLTDKSDLEDLALDGRANFNPSDINVDSSISFLIQRQKVGQGTILADKSQLVMNFDFNSFPLEYLSIFSDELKNPYLPALAGPSLGVLKFHKNLKSGSVDLESRFTFDGSFPLDATHQFPGKWQFSFSDSKWETSFITPKSEVSFFRRSIIDVPRGEVVQYVEEIGFSGIPVDPAVSGILSLPQFAATNFPMYFSSKVSLKDCVQGEALVSGTIIHGLTPLERFYKVDLKSSGSFQLNYLDKEGSEKLSATAEAFPWSEGYSFLVPVFTAKSGVFTGKIDGKWQDLWSTGTWMMQLKAASSTDLQGTLPALAHKLWSEFAVDAPVFADQSWNTNLKNNTLTINAFTLESEDPAKLVGSVSPAPKKSHLILNYPKNKKWKAVRKDLPEFTW